ncbi:MAG: right-handed parallel beta-helix repeat-containing protein [Deltaproteobacteria bacterium]|nr:right-handed parallel beta-helix repeat-containing protein [Deltaproteobacteria bacterium]
MMNGLRAVIGMTLLASLVVLGVGSARADEQISGPGPFTIFKNTRLVGDVDCTLVFAGPCILIGRDNIELKLNGFTITGPVATLFDLDGPGPLPPFGPIVGCGGQLFFPLNAQSTFFPGLDGINTGGFSHVKIRGPGKVLLFGDHGIHVSGGRKVEVRGVASGMNCHNGIQLSASDSEVRDNVTWNNSSFADPSLASPPPGIPLVGSGGIEVAGNNNRVRRNEAIGNGVETATALGLVLFGIGVTAGTGNEIEENGASGNFPNGIVLFQGTSGNVVRRNLALANSTINDAVSSSGGLDILELGGSNTFRDNLCQTAFGTTACPNTPKFAGHKNAHDD